MGVASGMFYVLAGGVVLALTVFVIQWMYYKRSKNQKAHGKKLEVRLTLFVFYIRLALRILLQCNTFCIFEEFNVGFFIG